MKAVCVNNKDQEERLTLEKSYDVLQVNTLQDGVFIKCDDNRLFWMCIERFKLGEQELEKQIPQVYFLELKTYNSSVRNLKDLQKGMMMINGK